MFTVVLFLFQLAKLPPDDMNAVNNMKLLGGVPDTKKSTGAFSLKFDIHKVNVYRISESSFNCSINI